MTGSAVGLLPAVGWQAIATTLGVFLLGGMVKGGFGFGLPLVTISILPLVIPIEMALAVNSIVLPLTNVFQYVQARMMRETIVRFWPMLAGLAIGIPIGATLVSLIDQRLLVLSLGLFVMVFVVMTAFNPRLRIPAGAERPVAAVTGVGAGIVGALTTANGPVFVTYLVGIGAERRLMVSALGLFFLFSGVLIAGSFWFIGILNPPRIVLALLCLPAALIGMRAGNALAEMVSARVFRMAVLAVLFGLGRNMVARATLAA